MLSRFYPHYKYRVLPEVRELDDDDDDRLRLDILVIDGFNVQAFGFELVVEANKNEFYKHCKRSKGYGEFLYK